MTFSTNLVPYHGIQVDFDFAHLASLHISRLPLKMLHVVYRNARFRVLLTLLIDPRHVLPA